MMNKLALAICLIFAVRIACCQVADYDSAPFDESLWNLSSMRPTAITNDASTLIADAQESGCRLSLDDGRPLSPFNRGSDLSMDCTLAARTRRVLNGPTFSSWIEIQKVSDGSLARKIGGDGHVKLGFDNDGNYYYFQDQSLFKENTKIDYSPRGSNFEGSACLDNDEHELVEFGGAYGDYFVQKADLDTGKILFFRAPSPPIPESTADVAVSPAFLACVDMSKIVKIYSMTDVSMKFSFKLPVDIVPQDCDPRFITKHPYWLQFKGADRLIYVIDFSSGIPLIVNSLYALDGVAVSPNGKVAAVARSSRAINDGKTRIDVIDLESNASLKSVSGLSLAASGPAYINSVNSETACIGTSILDVMSGKILHSRGDLNVPGSPYFLTAYRSSDGKFIAGRLREDPYEKWHILDGVTFDVLFEGPAEAGIPIGWSNKYLVCIANTKVTCWDPVTKAKVSEREFPGANGYMVAFALLRASDEFVAVAKDRRTMSVYDLGTWEVRRTFKFPTSDLFSVIHRIVPNSDGRYAAVLLGDEYAPNTGLMDMRTLSLYDEFYASDVYIQGLSCDGRYCSYYEGSEHRLYDAQLRKNLALDEKLPAALLNMLGSLSCPNDGELLIVGMHALRMPSSFGGVVNVPGRAGSKAEMPAQVNVYDSTGSLKKSRQTMLGNYGRFTAGLPLADGNYSLWIKPKGCLAAKASFVMPVGLKDWLPVSCIPGDCNGDNKVDATDVDALSNAFDTSEGDEGFSADCELTGDHYVGTDDYLLIGANLGKVGAALP